MKSFFIALCHLPAALGPVKVKKQGPDTYLIESLAGVLTLDLVADDEVTLDFRLSATGVNRPVLTKAIASLSFPHPFGAVKYLERQLHEVKSQVFRYPVDKALAQRLRETYEKALEIVGKQAQRVAHKHTAR